MLHAFDPTQAKASGLRGGLLHYGLLCMIALTIVATLQSVGIILSISLLIAPGAIALLLVRRFIHALLLAVSGGHRLLGGRGVAGVLSRQRASADYRGAVYRAVCSRLCRKHDPR
ncbi:manganese ABC transporter, inner membrane permease protein SitD [Klebsiella pneumoniae]|uniref:Manganese ABC transporter, inner membrane permease protein SitD n=1 Tax=Klebsiella pneumoniae TaxID=573 RepID=A0A377U1D9_KLEPN|nr:manganese ABC transporter, inner membrane permease protein SitD [Klebsiella pneumoniae]